MIYFLGAVAIGVFMGVVLEYFIDVGLMRELQDENRTLRMKLAEARKTRKVEHVETIEIIDPTVKEPENLFKPF